MKGRRGPDSRMQVRRNPDVGVAIAPRRAAHRSIETAFFRALNRVVEPIVRAGLGSPRIAPSGFIVLETRGRKTGRLHRTPLVATRLGRHVFVATFRGERSQWVRNLAAEPRIRFWLGGKPRDATAFVMHKGKRFRIPKSLPSPIQRVTRLVAPYTEVGWAFAILSPAAAPGARRCDLRQGLRSNCSSRGTGRRARTRKESNLAAIVSCAGSCMRTLEATCRKMGQSRARAGTRRPSLG